MPTYTKSSAILAMAKRRAESDHRDLKHARIAFLMEDYEPPDKPQEERKRPGKREWMGKVSKCSGSDSELHGYEFKMIIREKFWIRLSLEGQEALVDHELCHIRCDDKGFYVVPHDVEEFKQVLERHGFWQEDIREFVEAAPEQGSFQFKGEKLHHDPKEMINNLSGPFEGDERLQ